MKRPIAMTVTVATVAAGVVICLFLSGCGDSTQSQRAKQQGPSVVDGVRSEVATILKKKANEIDVSKPLVAQGADELDIVEIVMAVEEAFKAEIPDSVIGEKIGEVSKTLTVEKLAEVVSKQKGIK